jgi:hypothetical protein
MNRCGRFAADDFQIRQPARQAVSVLTNLKNCCADIFS